MVRVVEDDEIGIIPLYNPPDPSIDIIAIHGLGAHPDETWAENVHRGTDKASKWVSWLDTSNMLPNAVRSGRIMRFGYRSRWFGSKKTGAGPVYLTEIAENLLEELERVRKKDPNRPLIFIAHSFGGLVLMTMIRESFDNPEKWLNPLASTVGLLFLGTPFRGRDGMDLNEMVEAAARITSEEEVFPEVLKHNLPGSEFLMQSRRRFLEARKKDCPIPICCFYEKFATDVAQIVKSAPMIKFLVPRDSACLDESLGISVCCLERDHFDLNKFGKPLDKNYAAVRDVIVKMTREARATLKKRLKALHRAVDQSGSDSGIKHMSHGRNSKHQMHSGTRESTIENMKRATYLLLPDRVSIDQAHLGRIVTNIYGPGHGFCPRSPVKGLSISDFISEPMVRRHAREIYRNERYAPIWDTLSDLLHIDFSRGIDDVQWSTGKVTTRTINNHETYLRELAKSSDEVKDFILHAWNSEGKTIRESKKRKDVFLIVGIKEWTDSEDDTFRRKQSGFSDSRSTVIEEAGPSMTKKTTNMSLESTAEISTQAALLENLSKNFVFAVQYRRIKQSHMSKLVLEEAKHHGQSTFSGDEKDSVIDESFNFELDEPLNETFLERGGLVFNRVEDGEDELLFQGLEDRGDDLYRESMPYHMPEISGPAGVLQTSKKPGVYRVSDIPSSWKPEKLKAALESHNIEIISDIGIFPSVWTDKKCTAVVCLNLSASVLLNLGKQPVPECLLKVDDIYIVLDQHFHGLTAISTPVTGIKADIIAIHGLSGHAFGSWAHFDDSTKRYIMWLRDFLGEDVSNIRILIYGYEASLDKDTTMSELFDRRRLFMADLIGSRKDIQDRPLIFFGHGFGGTVIGQALEIVKFEQEKVSMQKLLRSILGVFFFGAPYLGLRTAEIRRMTKGRSEKSKEKLLIDIEEDSKTLRRVMDVLATICMDIQIVSVYEELQSPRVAKDFMGRWSNSGALETMVESGLTVLNLPFGVKIPAMANSIRIAKHSYRDGRYYQIKDELTKIFDTAFAGRNQNSRFSVFRRHERSSHCDGLETLGIAFAYSGATNWADTFCDLCDKLIKAYETAEQVDQSFIIFKLHCWKVIAWIETMKAAWTCACSKNSLMAIEERQSQFLSFDVSESLLKWTKKAVNLIQELQNLEGQQGSFEPNDAKSNNLHGRVSPFEKVNKELLSCIEALESFMPFKRRDALDAEISAQTLATVDDIKTMNTLEASSTPGLANSFRVKRELRLIRDQTTTTNWDMIKLIGCLQNSALISKKTTAITTYFEADAHHAKRVLIEWSLLDRLWNSTDIQLARKRISNLAKELSIEKQPTSLRTLQAIGVVEDFRHDLNKRFGMIYRLPKEHQLSNEVHTLHAFFPTEFGENDFLEPLLGERFELARALAVSVYELHASGWLHKEISSHKIVFLASANTKTLSIKEPFLIGFGYARPDEPGAVSLVRSARDHELYQHPNLRKFSKASDGQPQQRFKRKYDIYSLGLILLEIGIWDSISIFHKDSLDPREFTERLLRVCKRDLGHRMGAIYRDVVIRCIEGIQGEQNGDEELEDVLKRSDELMDMYWTVLNELSKCHCK